jgi:hypothetical protein
MDISNKIQELRASIQQSATDAKASKARVAELKALLDEKKKRDAELVLAQQEEAALLAQLNTK